MVISIHKKVTKMAFVGNPSVILVLLAFRVVFCNKVTWDVGSPENFISFALIRRKLFHLNTATFTPSQKDKKTRILISNTTKIPL